MEINFGKFVAGIIVTLAVIVAIGYLLFGILLVRSFGDPISEQRSAPLPNVRLKLSNLSESKVGFIINLDEPIWVNPNDSIVIQKPVRVGDYVNIETQQSSHYSTARVAKGKDGRLVIEYAPESSK